MRDFRDGSRSSSRSRNSGRSSFGGGHREMFNVICDECGAECQVPFRPSGDKPVLCSSCFGKLGKSNGSFGRCRGSSDRSIRPQLYNNMGRDDQLNRNFRKAEELLVSLNSKLDRVIDLLENKKTVRVTEAEMKAKKIEAKDKSGKVAKDPKIRKSIKEIILEEIIKPKKKVKSKAKSKKG